jgi:hypothetical protein
MAGPPPSPRSGVEEPTGTGSRGASRDHTSAGVGVDVDLRRQPHLSNHTQTLLIALPRCAIDGEARPTAHSERAEPPAGPVTTFPRTTPRAIRTPVGASAPRGRWRRPARTRSGSSSTASARPIRVSLVRVADLRPRRNGGDVQAGRTLSRRRARPPVLNTQLRAGPGPILVDRFRGSVPRLPSSARFRPREWHPEYGGTEPCRHQRQ